MEHYTYKITWSPEEQEYVGLCEEFPYLSHFDQSYELALMGIMQLIRGVIADILEKGEIPPEAIVDREVVVEKELSKKKRTKKEKFPVNTLQARADIIIGKKDSKE